MADKHVDADGLIKLLKGRKYRWAQVHHTWKPNHSDFNGSNHQSLQNGMRNYHVGTNGWSDIGQHATLFPDGTFVTGRSFGTNPAGIVGYNAGAFMIEMIGDFDKGKDKLEGKQLNAALKVYQYLMNHCGATILFHNEKAAKSCPGTGVDKAKFVKAAKNFNGKTPNVSSNGSTSSKSSGSKYKSVGSKWTGQVLRQYDKGGAVKDLQKLIGEKADGYFGPSTKKKVIAAQKKAGVTADGTPGPDTFNALKDKKSSGKKSKGANLKVDGKAGKLLVSALQKSTGSKYTDGVFSSQPRNSQAKAFYSGVTFGSKGSPSIGALQKKVGAKVDNKLGPDTVRKWQSYVGTPVDGVISRPYSNFIAETQKRLNKGTFGKDTYAALKGHKTKKSSDMAVDGKWGTAVSKGLQRYFGTPVDGILSNQSKNKVTRALYSNTARWGSGGSVVIKAMQKKLGVAADGLLGPATIRALQKRMGTPVDGKLSRVSPMVKELQKRLNKGTF